MVTKVGSKKAMEGDVVELLVDYPETGLIKGQRGVVITELDGSEEAFDLAVEDGQGNLVGFAYSVKPDQFLNLSRQPFEEGLALLEEMRLAEAEQVFARAVELQPSYIGFLLNVILTSFDEVENWPLKIHLLRFVSRLNPDYKLAKNNLAIAYLNWGYHLARENPSSEQAIRLFQTALTIEAVPDVTTQLYKNLAASFTALGVVENRQGKYEEALGAMRTACSYYPCEETRRNFAVAALHLAFQFIEDKNYEGAATVFELGEDAGLLHSDALNNYGIALVHVRRYDDAARAFEKALELSPHDPIILGNLDRLRLRGTAEEFVPEGVSFEHALISLAAQPYEQAVA